MEIDPFTGFVRPPRGGMPATAVQRRWENAPGTVVSRGLGRGVDTIQRNLGSALEGIGNVTGLEGLADAGARSVARNQAEIDASRAMENDSVATWLGSLFAENAPQTATSIGLPALGAGIGSAVPGVGTAIGFGIGTAASALFNYGQLAGENRERQKAENVARGLEPMVDEGRAFGTAVPQTALETLGGALQARLAIRARRAAGDEGFGVFSRQGAREIAGAAGRGAAIEGATEVGQTAMNRAQADLDNTSREALQELAIAGLAGAVLGGTLSAGGSAIGIQMRKPAEVSTGNLEQEVDRALGLPAPDQVLALPPPDAGPAALSGPEAALRLPPPREPPMAGDVVVTPPVAQPPAPGALPAPDPTLTLPAPAPGPQVLPPPGAPSLDTGADLAGGSVDAAPARPLQNVPDRQLFEQLVAAQSAAQSPLSTASEATAQIQAEMEARGLEITPRGPVRRAAFADATVQDLNRALVTLRNQEQQGQPLTEVEQELRTQMTSELELRRAERDGQLSMINPNATTDRTAFRDLRDGQRSDFVSEAADRFGAPKGWKNTRYAKRLRVRSTEELYDKVFDDVAAIEAFDRGENTRFDGPAGQRERAAIEAMADRLGDRDLGPEIAQAQQELEAARAQFPDGRRVLEQDSEAMAQFNAALGAQRAATARINELQTLQQNAEAAQARAKKRATTAAAYVGDPNDAVPLSEVLAIDPDATGPNWVDRATQNLTQGAPVGALGDALADAAAPITRERQIQAAENQRAAQNEARNFRQMNEGIANQALRDEAGIVMQRRGPLNNEGTPVSAPPGPARNMQVKSAIREAMGRIGMADTDVYVLGNAKALPDDVGGQLSRDFTDNGNLKPVSELLDADTNAVATDDGTVVIFADKVQSKEDAVALLYHEVLGHRGMTAMFGQDRAEAIMDLYDRSPALKDMVKQWETAVGPEAMAYYSKMPKWVQVEEAIAVKAESGPIRKSYLEPMLAIIRKYARMVGLKSKSINQRELNAILAEAHERAMRGEGAGVAKRPAPAENPRGPMPPPAQILDAAQTYGDPNTAGPVLRASLGAVGGLPNTPEGDMTAIGRIMKVAEKGAEGVRGLVNADRSEQVRGAALWLQSMGHIAQKYGKHFPMKVAGKATNALEHIRNAHTDRTVVQSIWSRLSDNRLKEVAALSKNLKEGVSSLMEATFYRLDPRKKLEDHTHLTPQERADRRKVYNRLRQNYLRMQRNPAARKAYANMIAVNEATFFQHHATVLYELIRMTPEMRANIPSARTNPLRRFVNAHKAQDDPVKARAFWEKELQTLLSETKTFVAARRTALDTGGRQDVGQITQMLTLLQAQLDQTDAQLREAKDYPYFHIGRFGEYAASFNLKTITDASGKKVADQRAVNAASAALEKLGYHNIGIREEADGAVVFIRTETREAAMDLERMAKELMQQGLVTEVKDSTEIDPIQFMPESTQRTVGMLVEQIRAMNMPVAGESQQDIDRRNAYMARLEADLKTAMLNSMPEYANAKVMAQREFRSGYSTNMLRAFAKRQQIAALSAANRLAGEMTTEGFQAMRDSVEAMPSQDKWRGFTIMREMQAREMVNRDDTKVSRFMGGARAFNHNYYLAMNPGYMLTQITQVWTNAMPELTKLGASNRQAARLLVQAAPLAAKIVGAAIRAAKAKGLGSAWDGTLSSEVLATVQLSPDPAKDQELKDFIMYMVNTGSIDIGSQTRQLGQAAENQTDSKFDTTMRFASSASYYLEMATRLTGTLAARELAVAQGKDLSAQQDAAYTLVDEAFFNYTEGNRARAIGRGGFAKEGTPLLTAFMTFPMLMTEKYTREIGAALGADSANPEERAAAQRWLKTHLAVMGVLAGGLGMPFVAIVAGVIDRLADLLGDDEEPFNVRANFRNFLADTFGEDVGEVLARGLPRAVGFDISSRVGAAEIVPFSQLISDRRPFSEAITAQTERAFGSALGIASDGWTGVGHILRGDILEGLRTGAPLAIRNPANALKMTTDGFTDSRGTLLPLTPTASDILYQMIGLTPAQRAEYSEANFAQAVRRGRVTRTATRIRKRIQIAVANGNRDALREAFQDAMEFDQNVDPSYAILPNIMRSVNQSSDRQSLARALDAPLGVRANDLGGQQLTRFMNL